MKTANAQEVLNNALRKIGNHNGTARPQPTNDEQKMAAWEYYVADSLAKMAEQRKKLALAVAIAQGVIPDYKKKPLDAGKSIVNYTDEVMTITTTTRNAATRFQHELFIGRLKAKHPKLAAEIDGLVAECTATNAVPHMIAPSLKE